MKDTLKEWVEYIAIIGLFAAIIFWLILILPKSPETGNLSDLRQVQLPGQTEVAPESQPQEPREISEPQETTKAVVSRVIDGDTVELDNGERVRLIGIDTPEKGRPYFEEAKDKLSELIEGKTVELKRDISERDRYGRLLRYIWLDGVFINLEMVRLGYATSYTYPPDVKYQEEILAAEREARESGIGLWALAPVVEEINLFSTLHCDSGRVISLRR